MNDINPNFKTCKYPVNIVYVQEIFWSFDLPAMPLDAFRIVPERMRVLEDLCSALTIFAWQAGIRISDLVVLKIHLFGQITFCFDVSLGHLLQVLLNPVFCVNI